jgi:serine/threonine protein kinase
LDFYSYKTVHEGTVNQKFRNLISMMERLKGQSPDERTIMKILTGVLNALELLHVNGVSHRDIKLENILESNDGEFKICDFGSASGEVWFNP